jgi:hydroxyethylthiazole kinase-like uncharacterized protein yjeF
MTCASDQVLTQAQMRAAEQALIDAGISVDELMQRAGHGAAEWVWRVAAGRPVTVLCGPGNNGGDGYVIAEALRQRGGKVRVIAAHAPKSPAAIAASRLYHGTIETRVASPRGEVLVDCLFGTGLTRALGEDDAALLSRLVAGHHYRAAIDLPSGVETDSGAALGSDLPPWHLTLALGAWKPAHFLMPACAAMGELRLVEIGIEQVADAPRRARQPRFPGPPADAHKYRRGLLGVIGGEMPGAALLAARAAQHAGAGYVKLLAQTGIAAPADVVVDLAPLDTALADPRYAALLVGPGLGRDGAARARLAQALRCEKPKVLDADALLLLEPGMAGGAIATPHEGELAALERSFGLPGSGSKAERAQALAAVSAMVIVAKGADTVIAAPDGRLVFTPRASSWLSTAGTGDVLAGCIAGRLATGLDPLTAAEQGVWLHGKAARLAGAAFTAGQLADRVQHAYAAAL